MLFTYMASSFCKIRVHNQELPRVGGIGTMGTRKASEPVGRPGPPRPPDPYITIGLFFPRFNYRHVQFPMSTGPKITLNTGFQIPVIGLGQSYKYVPRILFMLSSLPRNLAIATRRSSSCCDARFKRRI